MRSIIKKNGTKGGILFGTYVLILLVVIKQAILDSQPYYLLVVLIPTLFYIFNRYKNVNYRINFNEANNSTIAFYVIYYLIFAYNYGPLSRGITIIFILLLHIMISSVITSKPGLITINSLIKGLFLLGIFVVFIPTYYMLGTLSLGSFYNFTDPSALTTSTVDGPLIISLLFLLAIFDLTFYKNYTFLNISAVIFSFFVLLLFSRRGFIFSSVISLGIYYLYVRFNKKAIVYTIISLMFLPMFWDSISTLLVLISDSSIFSTLISRNDSETLLNATGRADSWLNVIKTYFEFKPSLLFGFQSSIPTIYFPSDDEHGRYFHAHNTFMQLFLEGGYFVSTCFVILLIISFKKYIKARKIETDKGNFYFIIIIFLLNLSATETLIRDVKFSNFIFCFALVAFNLYNSNVISSHKKALKLNLDNNNNGGRINESLEARL
ncbi:MAG: hypothetical protein EOO47_00410 [Flavobacterium sp.]|nr:MAG: hypothetical protein EOO47_00410 [Flavobacterium sp.]